MKYCIVGDSCTDLTTEDINRGCFAMVPLTVHVDGKDFIDDETFNQKEFLEVVENSKGELKSSCPSPEAYMEAYKKADEIYVITITAKLSGSHNSAVLATSLYEEEYGEKKIHVFDSKSAACGQYLIAMKIEELKNQGLAFEDVVEQVEAYIEEMETYFVLETLEVLQRNGRLSRVQAVLANTLSIKPVMGAEDGEIIKKAQSRGIKKALAKMTQLIAEEGRDFEKKTAVISHCNCEQRAEDVKKQLLAAAPFKDVKIIPTGGLSTLYACDGGIVVAF